MNKRMMKMALVSAILVALFWGAWQILTGHVPVQTLRIGRLTLSMSRWWDVPFAAIWATILVGLFTHPKIRSDQDAVIDLVVSLAAGLGFGLAAGLAAGRALLTKWTGHDEIKLAN